MQNKRPRRKGARTVSQEATAPAAVTTAGRRRARVRNRLVVAVAVVIAAVAGAGAPGILAASDDLGDSQELLTLSEQTQSALALAHALADERDELTGRLAAGRAGDTESGRTHRARVDRQIREMRVDAPAEVRRALDTIPAARRAAQAKDAGALDAHRAYATSLTALHRLAERLAERIPARAPGGSHALAELDTAVQQASAARGLLLAALAVPRGEEITVIDPVTGLPTTEHQESRADRDRRRALTEAARRAHQRSEAALADFHDNAAAKAVRSYDSAVTGSRVREAEDFLNRLTDEPVLSDSELGLDRGKVDAALSARIETMRGAESSLNVRRSAELADLRDEDVTALEIRAVLLGLCVLLAAGFSMATFRSLTRPLAVLRLGSARVGADPAAEEPIRFTGRNDEFAEVVSSVNALHAHATALHERLGTLDGERRHLIGQRQMLAEEREGLREQLARTQAQLERMEHNVHSTFVSLALRTLGLVERQLAVIERLEDREQDPDRLATLFKLDHFATLMRRHSENLLVLAGAEHRQPDPGPVPLIDVVRAAVSEIERYERVRVTALPAHTHIAGFAADDLSHLLAELLDNAAAFSPPDTPVEISGWLLENGDVMLSAVDEGIGLDADRLRALNSRLSDFDPDEPYIRSEDEDPEGGLGLGLYVAGRLAHRLRVRVQLRAQKTGGVAAVLVLPKSVLSAAPAQAKAPRQTAPEPGAAGLRLPGSEAEANSNALAGRTGRVAPAAETREPGAEAPEPAAEAPGPEGEAPEPVLSRPASAAGGKDPLIAAAERAVRAAAAAEDEGFEDGRSGDGRSEVEWSEDGRSGDEQSGDGRSEVERTDVPTDGPRTEAEHPEAEHPGAELPETEHPADTQPAAPVLTPPSLPRQRVAADTHERAAAGPAEDVPGAADPAGPGPDPASGHPEEYRSEEYGSEDHGPAGNPYAIGPDSHERAPDEFDPAGEPQPVPAPYVPGAAAQEPPAAGPPIQGTGPEPAQWERLTDKGLPKRTPRITAPVTAPAPRSGGVDPQELRRRLGGFHRGSLAGRRDADAELAEKTGEHQGPGDTVEEATS